MPLRIDVAVLPFEAEVMEADCYVVVDILRATTTIATLFAGGLRDLIAVNSLAYARELAARDDRLLFGEVGGLPPEGFDYGNSPVEARDAEVTERGAVLFTTNGTAALCSLASGARVLTGALANASAVAAALAGYGHVVITCAGNAAGRRFSLEDFATAGVIAARAQRLNPGAELGDAAGLAVTAPGYENWLAVGLPQRTAASARMIAGSEHGRVLAGLGLSGDIHFSAQEDTSSAVPMVVDYGEGWARLVDSSLAVRGG